MTGQRRFGTFVACILLLTQAASGQNLAKYREFEFGMSVDSVLKQTQSEPGSIKTMHTAPDLIQTLQWNRSSYFSSSNETDPVRSIRFDFHNNQLFKIVTAYGSRQLEGMTADDLIDAISKTYGVPTRPDESIVVSSYAGYQDKQKVVARWENAENSYSLFRSSFGGEFGLVASAKKLDVIATASILEAERLDVLAAPQREIERAVKDAQDRLAAEEKAKGINKPNFRP